jgi:hypothetical protein
MRQVARVRWAKGTFEVLSSILQSSLRLGGLRSLCGLPAAERQLVLRTIPLVATIRVALWVIPFRRVRHLLRRSEQVTFPVSDSLPISRLEWAVRAASRRIPMATCLTQSLALQFLLAKTGRPSQLHIGVKKDPKSGFRAHAWVELEGCALLNTPADLDAYARIAALEELSA